MRKPNNKSDELYNLLGALREGIITDEQFSQLEQFIASDINLRQLYIDYIQVCVELRKYHGISNSNTITDSVNIHCDNKNNTAQENETAQILLESIEQDERLKEQSEIKQAIAAAKAKEIEVKKFAEEALQQFKQQEELRLQELAYKEYRARRFQITVALSSASILLVILVLAGLSYITNKYKSQEPKDTALPIVAQLGDSINISWEDKSVSSKPGTTLAAKKYILQHGIAEIIFNSGGKIILEAPAEIRLLSSSSMLISRGKLTADLKDDAAGFTINTPAAKFIDIGTQFGVSVTENGQSELHVFDGKVVLFAGKDKTKQKINKVINAGQAESINASGSTVKDILLNRTAFLHRVPSAYEIAVRNSRPLVYWRFDGDVNGICKNYQSDYPDFDGRYTGSFKFVDGPKLGNNVSSNKALAFNFENSIMVQGVSRDLFHNRGYSIAIWIKLSDFKVPGQSIGNSWFNIISALPGPFRYISVNSGGYFAYRPSSKRINGRTVIELDKWYFVVITARCDGFRHLYVNGRDDCQPALLTYGFKSGFCDLREDLQFGAVIKGNKHIIGFAGALDEVAVWNRVLSANEIASFYKSANKYWQLK